MDEPILITIVKAGIIATGLMLSFAVMTLVERKLVARFTMRYGPNRAGKYGLLQPVADMFKMFFKEEIIPGHVDRLVYYIAPAVALVPALLTFAFVPLAGEPLVLPFEIFSTRIVIYPWIANVNVGLLFVLAIGSLGTYGVILGGWSSNNKYSLLGGLRTSAMMLSYELPMGVALLSVIMLAGTLELQEIVRWQGAWWGFRWFAFLQPIAFIVYFISALAEAGRSPFDLPETENELISGFATEYGGMKFGLFFGAEYVHTVVLSALGATLFLGGWQGPFVNLLPWLGPVYLFAKIAFMVFVIIWVRASIPRVRFDKMMKFCWKFLIPLGLVNLVITALIVAIFAF